MLAGELVSSGMPVARSIAEAWVETWPEISASGIDVSSPRTSAGDVSGMLIAMMKKLRE